MEASMVDERTDHENRSRNGDESQPGLARRQFLKMAGISGAAMAAAPLVGRIPSAAATTTPSLLRQPAVMGAPVAEQLHLTFGQDTARSMVASWSTPSPVRRPRVRLGIPQFGFGREVTQAGAVHHAG
jgi:hypothetical protein